MKIVQIAPLKPGTIVASAGMRKPMTVIRRVGKNLYEVQLPQDFHDSRFSGFVVTMQRNQLSVVK